MQELHTTFTAAAWIVTALLLGGLFIASHRAARRFDRKTGKK